MATTDTNVPQVIVNKLTSAEYATATKSPTEFYAVTDELIDTADIANGAITTAKIASGALLDLVYPVGSIYMSATLSTPAAVASALGGTWVAWGSGRVPVGVDTNDTDFDTAEETGGNKTHRHDFKIGTRFWYGAAVGDNFYDHDQGAYSYSQDTFSKGTPTQTQWSTGCAKNNGLVGGVTSENPDTHVSTGDTDTGSSLQPYITCYMYKRTA